MKLNPKLRPLSRKNRVVFLGSCFSNQIGSRIDQLGYSAVVNPHGTLYHPLSILGVIRHANRGDVDDSLMIERDEVYSHWFYHSDMSGLSKDEVRENIETANRKIPNQEEDVQWVITLGSAWVSELEDGTVVANNHKMPSSNFLRRLLSVEEMVEPLRQWIDELPPSNHVYFTVSPVRHKREGWVGNNRSKARLIECVHLLCQADERVEYIPSYEFIIDELRDRLFFAEDGVHPNAVAVNRLWEVLSEWWFDEKDRGVNADIDRVLSDLEHRPRFPQTKSYEKHLASVENKLKNLSERGVDVERFMNKLVELRSK